MTRGPFDRLATTAGLVFLADFATKQWALATLGATADSFGAGWHLTVVNNTHLAGGMETGGFELPLTGFLTIVIVTLVLRICRPLSAVDASAPAMLGLVVGAGAGNLADALIPPHGVVDFVAFTARGGLTTTFNLADVALVAALALSLRTVWRIVLAIRGRVHAGHARHSAPSGALVMRDRILVSAGHALLATCAFIWLYSMAIAFTPDAGRSAPSSLVCGLAVFAVAFLVSQARQRVMARQVATARTAPSIERVVLDGSLPVAPLTDGSPRPRPRALRHDVVTGDEHQPEGRDLV